MKERRRSEAVNSILNLPIIQIHYAEKDSPNKGIEEEFHEGSNGGQGSRSVPSFSMVAQDGLELIRVLTNKLLPLPFGIEVEEQSEHSP